jgi:hypothetical protein
MINSHNSMEDGSVLWRRLLMHDAWIDSIGVKSVAQHHFLNLLFPGGNIPIHDFFLVQVIII